MRKYETLAVIILSGFITMMTAGSCKTTVVLAIPSRFSEQAVKMEVKGSRSRYVSFGDYKTSKIKRGWFTRSSYSSTDHSLEASFMRAFGVNRRNEVTKEKDNFRFTLTNSNRSMQVLAEEMKFNVDRTTKIGDGVGFLQSFSKQLEYEYSFHALISYVEHADWQPWRLVMGNMYDYREDTSKRFIKYAPDRDEGYVTNGTDSVIIREIRTKKSQGPDGKEVNMPFELRTGYELRMDGGISAIVDVVKKEIWFYNELEENDRLLLAAISTALMVRRVKDVRW